MEMAGAAGYEEESGNVGAGGGADTRGKHRILAELGRVEQETRFLEKELEELERMDNISIICEELLHIVETRPDPLLPITKGPFNLSWDQWFEGPKGAQGCSCLIL